MSADVSVQMFEKPRKRRSIAEAHINVLVRIQKLILEAFDAAEKASFRSRIHEIATRLDASVASVSVDAHGVIVSRSSVPLK